MQAQKKKASFQQKVRVHTTMCLVLEWFGVLRKSLRVSRSVCMIKHDAEFKLSLPLRKLCNVFRTHRKYLSVVMFPPFRPAK